MLVLLLGKGYGEKRCRISLRIFKYAVCALVCGFCLSVKLACMRHDCYVIFLAFESI